MMKNVFNSYWKLFLFLFNIVSWLFGDLGKQLDKKAKVEFKIYDVTEWETNNYNTHTAQYIKK